MRVPDADGLLYDVADERVRAVVSVSGFDYIIVWRDGFPFNLGWFGREVDGDGVA